MLLPTLLLLVLVLVLLLLLLSDATHEGSCCLRLLISASRHKDNAPYRTYVLGRPHGSSVERDVPQSLHKGRSDICISCEMAKRKAHSCDLRILVAALEFLQFWQPVMFWTAVVAI